MGRIIDNLLAYKVLRMLVTNFTDTEAFMLGIIDANGNTLIKSSQFTTDEQHNAYDYLHRLVFNLKKMINKFGGESQLKSMAAAIWLIRENYQSGSKTTSQLESKFKKIMESNIHLVEEEILVGRFLKEDGVVANVTGPAVSTDTPVVKLNKKGKPLSGILGTPAYIARRKPQVK